MPLVRHVLKLFFYTNSLELLSIYRDTVRNYKRKTERGNYGSELLTEALQATKDGVPVIRASKEFGVPTHTLRRHRYNAVSQPVVQLVHNQPVLPKAIEMVICEHVQFTEKALYGLTTFDMIRLAFEVVEMGGICHHFSKKAILQERIGYVGSFLVSQALV